MSLNYRQTASLSNSIYRNQLSVSSSINCKPHNRFSKNIVVSQIDPFPTMGPCEKHQPQTKVLKLIGDKQSNIRQLVDEFGCVCGAKAQFKNIIVLLMDKIYRLRDQRNALKQELALLLQTAREQHRDKLSCNLEDSLLQTAKLQALQAHLLTEKDDQVQIDIPVLMTEKLKTEDIEQLFAVADIQNTARLNETNLLSSPSIDQQDLLLSQDESVEVLQQRSLNTQAKSSRAKDIASFLHNRHINKKRLQNYIEKRQCQRELGKYDEDKRSHQLF